MQQTPNVCHSELAMLTGQGGTTTTGHASVSIAHAPSQNGAGAQCQNPHSVCTRFQEHLFPNLAQALHCTCKGAQRQLVHAALHVVAAAAKTVGHVKSWRACSAFWCLCRTLARDPKHCCVNKTEVRCPVQYLTHRHFDHAHDTLTLTCKLRVLWGF